jgi:hypothetical protein
MGKGLEVVMIRDSVPAEGIAGDTWRWTIDYPDHPAPTWVVTFYFENADETFNKAATASGTAHAFSLDSVTTAAKRPGRYRWTARAVSAGVAETVASGWIEIRIDPAAAGNADPRSVTRRTLDALEAFLSGNATTAQQSTTIQGRAISRWPLNDLLTWQEKLRQRVKAEEGGLRSANSRNIKIRYSRV